VVILRDFVEKQPNWRRVTKPMVLSLQRASIRTLEKTVL
jgi:hypothetical protein